MNITEKALKAAARRCFNSFLNAPTDKTNPLQKALSATGIRVDDKLSAGTLTTDDLADYELAAMKLAFNAGFTAALEFIKSREEH